MLGPSFVDRLADQPDEELKVSFSYGTAGFRLHWLTSDSSGKSAIKSSTGKRQAKTRPARRPLRWSAQMRMGSGKVPVRALNPSPNRLESRVVLGIDSKMNQKVPWRVPRRRSEPVVENCAPLHRLELLEHVDMK